jgi:hypothetical protein
MKDESSTFNLLIQQFTGRVEGQLDFDLLEAASAAHHDLADEVTAGLVVEAQIVGQVDAAFDALAAAIALDGEDVKVALRTGGCA